MIFNEYHVFVKLTLGMTCLLFDANVKIVKCFANAKQVLVNETVFKQYLLNFTLT